MSSYFPSYEEFLMLIMTDIRKIYYFGDITDERSVKFLNDVSGGRFEDGSFEIIKLESDK